MAKCSVPISGGVACFEAPPLEHRDVIRDLYTRHYKGEVLTRDEVGFLVNVADMATTKLFTISMQTRSGVRGGKFIPVKTDEAEIATGALEDIDNEVETIR